MTQHAKQAAWYCPCQIFVFGVFLEVVQREASLFRLQIQ